MKGVNENGNETQIKATQDGKLEVRAIVETELEHASAKGRAYAWSSANSDIDAGDTRLFIKNTSDKFLIFSYATFTPANVVCTYDLGIGAATTTPAGTTVSAVNLNGTVTVSESYTAIDDETAVVDAARLMSVTTNTTESYRVELDGVILGKNQYLQINQETESTSGRVTVFGHFEEELV
ncbi:hypothetical protein OAP25_02075 [Flavobacteriaceae bacterium]|nr:hypothetical protein [Flavobacteriaceae bacterium]